MAAFDNFVQTAKIENNLNSLKDFQNFKAQGNCENLLKYFKFVEQDETNPLAEILTVYIAVCSLVGRIVKRDNKCEKICRVALRTGRKQLFLP